MSCRAVLCCAGGRRMRPVDGGRHRRRRAPRALHHRRRGHRAPDARLLGPPRRRARPTDQVPGDRGRMKHGCPRASGERDDSDHVCTRPDPISAKVAGACGVLGEGDASPVLPCVSRSFFFFFFFCGTYVLKGPVERDERPRCNCVVFLFLFLSFLLCFFF